MRKNDKRGGYKNKQRINEKITERQVRLINAAGDNVGIVSIEDAMLSAKGSSLDLVEISPDAEPPVCKVMDYGKHLFEQKKAKAAAKKKQKVTHLKEIKFRPGTDIGDYQVKLRNLIRFLEDGDKTKITVRFRGREMAHQELGMELLKRVEKDLEEYGTVESRPSMEGRQMTMMIGPKKKK